MRGAFADPTGLLPLGRAEMTSGLLALYFGPVFSDTHVYHLSATFFGDEFYLFVVHHSL